MAKMNTSKILVTLLKGTMREVATYPSPFRPDLARSDITSECAHFIRERFGYNSEKRFNNPLFLKGHCSQGRWQQ
jgi:hypothetical protein